MMQYSTEACEKKHREWEVKIEVLESLKRTLEARIAEAEKGRLMWSTRWREALIRERV